MSVIRLKSVMSILIIPLFFCITFIDCYGDNSIKDSTASLGNNDFLDIIIDDRHAYAYLSYSNNEGKTKSIYSSLMPEGGSGRKNLEGIDRFPTILECLLREEKPQDFLMQNLAETLTIKEFISAFFFGIYYLLSSFFETSDLGRVVGDRPVRNKIKIQRRFYLTPGQLVKAKNSIHKSYIESVNGKILYDILHYNCVDYVKDIYNSIGLNETQGEFLSQFDNIPNHQENRKNPLPFTILKIYAVHNEGSIGPMKVAKGIWKGIQMLSLRNKDQKVVVKKEAFKGYLLEK